MDTTTLNPELKTAQERIRRFERLGGVDLSRHEFEDPIHALVHVGTAEYKQALFLFECDFCHHQVRSNQEMEPLCTGPSWTDDHPPEVMKRVWRPIT